jgi:hypothetical protein
VAPGEIELAGIGFDVSEKDNNHVTIGGAAAKVAGARIDDDMSVLSVTVPGPAESGEIVVETPAGRSKVSGFQVKPIIDNIEPKKRSSATPCTFTAGASSRKPPPGPTASQTSSRCASQVLRGCLTVRSSALCLTCNNSHEWWHAIVLILDRIVVPPRLGPPFRARAGGGCRDGPIG